MFLQGSDSWVLDGLTCVFWLEENTVMCLSCAGAITEHDFECSYLYFIMAIRFVWEIKVEQW